MPLPEPSLNPVQLAEMVLMDFWKSMSPPVPSRTVPGVGPTVSTSKPSELATVELPARSVAWTLM